MKTSYEVLLEKYGEIYLLGTLRGVLYWDLNTYMPKNALNFRTKQFNWLQQFIHKRWTNPEFGSLIKQSEADQELNDVQKRNIELLRREYENKTVLPSELVGALASQSNKTLEVWKRAKAKNSFQSVVPDLKKLFDLNMKRAELLARSKGLDDPYEALINNRDYGFSVKKLSKIFDETKSFLVPFIKKCCDSPVQPDTSILSRLVPITNQKELVKDIARFLEYNLNTGSIDEVEHPLTIGCGPDDIRITVKYQDQIMPVVSAAIHECGHALDALQRKREWRGQPINLRSSPSFGESQSRFLQNIIGMSREFWTFYYPHFQKLTNGVFDDISLNEFYFTINSVKPGVSRLGADELTYCLHIIIRFEIEYDLFAGLIEVMDLPHIWNEKYAEYLGVEVPSDTLGVMQDLHWFSRYWGYFYGYGIGDIMASQITTALTIDRPTWRESLQNGNFSLIREWLAHNIHQKGALFDSLDLLENITGEPLTVKYFIKYLKEKYSELYSLV
ncbi:MAG: carboxypeptidase M32 [Candidatus Heimdallarchaeota archaeon]|nr:MAG: carboxypeptidase M32 [Candidatus Heimdallarchaeota archaeon]